MKVCTVLLCKLDYINKNIYAQQKMDIEIRERFSLDRTIMLLLKKANLSH